MTKNSEYDVIGELFRQRLENHRLPVGADGWNEIERRLNKRKNNVVIWLWSSGAMAAAAAIAMLIVINLPKAEKAAVMTVSQEATTEQPATTNYETNIIVAENETASLPQPQPVVVKPTNNVAFAEMEKTENKDDTNLVDVMVETELFIAAAENNNNETQTEEKPLEEIFQIVNEIFKSNNFLYEDIPAAKKRKKWLLAAAFSTNGNNSENFYNSPAASSTQLPQNVSTRGSFNNDYAVGLSNNIKPLSGTNKDDFTKIKHLPPLSFGMMVRKVDDFGGVESGLLYTYLSSILEWSDVSGNYSVYQNLHYVGIPVNFLIYMWNKNPNWQIYFSGGLMVEKGIRAMYNQDMQTRNQVRTTTVKKSFVNGVQLSMNSALGVNYKLEKGWGVYIEPRFGYNFDCDQPVSIRTESPLNVGVNMGLNYEFGTKK